MKKCEYRELKDDKGTVLLSSFCGVSRCAIIEASANGRTKVHRHGFQHFRCVWRNVGIGAAQELVRGGFAGLNSNIFAVAGGMFELVLLRSGDEVDLQAYIPTFSL